MADSAEKERKPQDWEKAISVAYLRCIGQTQATAAEAAGVGERTIRDWENAPWWPQAVAEAHARWLTGIAEKAKRALAVALDASDPQSARWVLERMLPEMAPPKQRQEISGSDGSPLKVELNVTPVTPALTDGNPED